MQKSNSLVAISSEGDADSSEIEREKPSWFQNSLKKISLRKPVRNEDIRHKKPLIPALHKNRPLTKFKYFLNLPDELQLLIINTSLGEPRAVIIEAQRPLHRHSRLSFDGLFAVPSPLLQVCYKFREEGKKRHPLSFAVSEFEETSPAWVRFNFDIDHLIIPQTFLQVSSSIYFHDLHRVKHLVIAWDSSLAYASRKAIDRLITIMPNLETLDIISDVEVNYPLGTLLRPRGVLYADEREFIADMRVKLIQRGAWKLGIKIGVVGFEFKRVIEVIEEENPADYPVQRTHIGFRKRLERRKRHHDADKQLKKIRRTGRGVKSMSNREEINRDCEVPRSNNSGHIPGSQSWASSPLYSGYGKAVQEDVLWSVSEIVQSKLAQGRCTPDSILDLGSYAHIFF